GGAWCWLSTTPGQGGHRWLSEPPTSTQRVLVWAGTREPRWDPWCLHEEERLVDSTGRLVLRIVSKQEATHGETEDVWCAKANNSSTQVRLGRATCGAGQLEDVQCAKPTHASTRV
ncbi:hypothetical protein TorRG33x02_352520, partial [Trema orientale]